MATGGGRRDRSDNSPDNDEVSFPGGLAVRGREGCIPEGAQDEVACEEDGKDGSEKDEGRALLPLEHEGMGSRQG